jgi:hypothetical protein
MADPDVVGRKLAAKIGARKAVVTPGSVESIRVFVTRMMPRLMGRFLSGGAAAAREESEDRSEHRPEEESFDVELR